MGALGESFRTARESQGLTLGDVADRIHIRSVYLAAIEAEDWNAIGPAVYTRGFLRMYARTLGLDSDAVLARFAGSAAGSAPTAAAFAPPPRSDPAVGGRAGGAAKPGLSIGAIAGVLVALALVIFVVYEYFDYQRGEPVAVGAVRSTATAKPSMQRARAAGQVRAAVKPEERPSGFTLRLADSSWLRVIVDGKVTMEGLYPKGTDRTFSGRSATVRVGNAGGVDISVDGKDLGPMGGLGDVAERSFQL